MANEIFHVDWIFVDTIIIILLFLLLISVRIFKSTHRWRSSFSNNALERYTFSEIYRNTNRQFIKIEKPNLTKNASFQEEMNNYPIILILQTWHKKRLNHIITEGLSSYGFNTLNLKIKISCKSYSKEVIETINHEIKTYLSKIIDIIKLKKMIMNTDYFLIICSKTLILPSTELLDSKGKGGIIINPKITKNNYSFFKGNISNSESNKLPYYIFNTKNSFFIKNRSYKRFIAEFESSNLYRENILTIQKSNRNFKYYETILLGILIDILEDNVLNY